MKLYRSIYLKDIPCSYTMNAYGFISVNIQPIWILPTSARSVENALCGGNQQMMLIVKISISF